MIRAAVILGFVSAACSSSTSPLARGRDDADAAAAVPGRDGGKTSLNTECTDPTGLEFAFPEMYSAYDGVHDFQVANLVKGVSNADLSFAVSDDSIASLSTGDVEEPVLTTRKPGRVTLTAKSADGSCGQAVLYVSAATAADWMAGNARYDDGQALPPISFPLSLPRDGSNPLEAGGARPACVDCHTEGSMAPSPVRSITYTPEQTCGFDDSTLKAAFTAGKLPPGGYFDPSSLSLDHWSVLHRFTLTDAEARGLVVYLRSFKPRAVDHPINFPGFVIPRDAGADAH